MTNKSAPEARTDVGQGGWSIDDFLSDFRPPAQVVHLTARGDLLARHGDLKMRYDAAKDLEGEGLDDYGAAALEDELEQVRSDLHESLRAFTVKAVGDRGWSDLIAAHPATDADKKDNRFAEWHSETFWPAAFATCIVEPSMTVDAAVKMIEQIDAGQIRKLQQAVVEVNGGGADIPKSVRSSASRRSSRPNSPM